jgi:hypothetical protein
VRTERLAQELAKLANIVEELKASTLAASKTPPSHPDVASPRTDAYPDRPAAPTSPAFAEIAMRRPYRSTPSKQPTPDDGNALRLPSSRNGGSAAHGATLTIPRNAQRALAGLRAGPPRGKIT